MASPVGRKARYLFAVWTVGGNKTVLLNLQSTISERPDIDSAWVPIEMYPHDWITRVPPISFLGVWRNSAAAWLKIRPLENKGGRFDAAYYLGYSIVTFLWRFRRRVPYALALDLTPLWAARNALWYALPRFDPASPISRFKHAITRSVFTGASHLLPFSTGVRDSLISDYGIPPEKITVLPPGIDLRRWSIQDREMEVREKRAVPLRVLHVGRDFKRKGGDLLVALAGMKEFAETEFHFVTDSYEGPHLKNVFVHGNYTENSPDLIAAYRDADVFVLPTRADTYSWA
ncbi:MAG: glycosyltransferase family 4 protein, partial [Bacteroidota bacterium]